MKSFLNIGAVVFLLGSLISCKEPFDPRGQFNEQMVVYSILLANSDTQFVRISTTYNPSGYDPLTTTTDTPVDDAQLTISGGGKSYQFHDTTIVRVDKSRYPTDIKAFVTYGMTIQSGIAYLLTVTSPTKGVAKGSVIVPGSGSIVPVNPYVLDAPFRYSFQDIAITAIISSNTKGYILKILLNYEYTVNSVTISERTEVPFHIRAESNQVTQYFPTMTRRVSQATGNAANYETFVFSNDAYRYVISNLMDKYQGKNLRFRSAVIVLEQIEPNFYNYYNIANGFLDQFSIRTDQPDYTNISGGIGVFGAMAVDSLYHTLPGQLN